MPDIIVVVLIGVAGGWLAGMLGVGGGAIFVPAMVLLLDRPQHEAQGVSLAVIVVTAIAATYVHRQQGNIDGRTVVWVTPIAMGTGLIGGVLATRLPAETLQRIFALVLIVLSTRMLSQAWRRPSESPQEPVL